MDKEKQLIEAITDWLSLPKEARPENAQTLEDLAETLNVGVSTVYRLRKKHNLDEKAAMKARAELNKHIPEIFNSLVRAAKKGSFHHIKLALELTNQFTDEININHSRTEERRSDLKEKLEKALGSSEDESNTPSNGNGLGDVTDIDALIARRRRQD